jgi:hypothetical protein
LAPGLAEPVKRIALHSKAIPAPSTPLGELFTGRR